MDSISKQELREYVYFAFEVEEAEGIRVWGDLFERFFQDYRLDLCTELLQEAKSRARNLCPSCRARIRFAEGELRQRQGNLAKARQCYEESLALRQVLLAEAEEAGCQANEDPAGRPAREAVVNLRRAEVARCWHQMGKLHADQGTHMEAVQDFGRAVELGTQAGLDQDLGSFLLGLGDVCRVLGRYEDAEASLRDALKIAARTRDRTVSRTALYNLGLLYGQQSKFVKAQRYLEASLRMAEKVADRARLGAIRRQLGSIYQAQKQYDKALRQYDAAIAHEREIKNQKGIAAACHQRGSIYRRQGELQKAEEQFVSAIRLWQAQEDKLGEAQTRHQLGNNYHAQGRFDQAREQYELSLALGRELGDRAGEMWALYQLGMLSQDQRDLVQAEMRYRESIRIARDIGDLPGEGRVLHQLGIISQALGNYADARRCYCEALTLWSALSDDAEIAQAQHQLGAIAQLEGDYAEARRRFEGSLEIERRQGNAAGAAASLCHLATLDLAGERYSEAQALLEEALGLWQCAKQVEAAIVTHHQLGSLHGHQGDYVAASKEFRNGARVAAEAGNDQWTAMSLHWCGVAECEAGRHDQARNDYHRAIELWRQLDHASGEGQTRLQLGTCYEGEGDLEAARREYELALALARRIDDREGITVLERQLAAVSGRLKA